MKIAKSLLYVKLYEVIMCATETAFRWCVGEYFSFQQAVENVKNI